MFLVTILLQNLLPTANSEQKKDYQNISYQVPNELPHKVSSLLTGSCLLAKVIVLLAKS